MIAYFDTSALVPLFVEEPASARCARLWDEADRVVAARIVYVEARAALAQARRLGRLSARALGRAVEDLDRSVAQIDHVEIAEQLVRDAGALSQDRALRGYDAVHLAAAVAIAGAQTVLVTGDDDLASAAGEMGLAVALTTGVAMYSERRL